VPIDELAPSGDPRGPGAAPASEPVDEGPDRVSEGAAGLERVRELLIGDERARLEELRRRLDDPERQSETVARALPRAISRRTAEDDALGRALAPTIEAALQSSVRKNPQAIASALFPVIGPAIRKSIANALASMVERLNRTLEEALSPRGLRWRLEALRTQRPFAEVVLLHTLVFRVEQVLLVHRETGLLLAQAVARDVRAKDGVLVSGMLTAIQDFVRDSFEPGRSDAPNQLRVGDVTVLVSDGPRAVLAAVVRGVPPPELPDRLDELGEAVHREFAHALSDFDGDATPFAPSEPLLEACLLEKRREPARGGRRGLGAGATLLAVAGAALIFVVAWAAVRFAAASEARAAELVRVRSALQAEPGLVVLDARRTDGRIEVYGLRDPFAAEPAEVLTRTGVDPARVGASWEPYYAQDPALVLRRVRHELEPPPTVELGLEDGRLVASGFADRRWIARLRLLAPLAPGVRELDTVALRDPELERLLDELRACEAARVPFVGSGSAVALEPGPWARLATRLRAIDAHANRLELLVRLSVSAPTAPGRAEAVRRALQELGLSRFALRAVDAGGEGAGSGTTTQAVPSAVPTADAPADELRVALELFEAPRPEGAPR